MGRVPGACRAYPLHGGLPEKERGMQSAQPVSEWRKAGAPLLARWSRHTPLQHRRGAGSRPRQTAGACAVASARAAHAAAKAPTISSRRSDKAACGHTVVCGASRRVARAHSSPHGAVVGGSRRSSLRSASARRRAAAAVDISLKNEFARRFAAGGCLGRPDEGHSSRAQPGASWPQREQLCVGRQAHLSHGHVQYVRGTSTSSTG